MGRANRTTHRFRVGAVYVDPLGNVISKDEIEVSLEPQVMDVLCVMADFEGEVVLRDTLIEQAWDVTHVSDESVTRVVSLLRKAFHDVGINEPYIETVQKRGYRLLAGVTRENIPPVIIAKTDSARAALSADLTAKGFLRKFTGLTLTLMAVAFLAVFLKPQAPANLMPITPLPSAPERSVAVLPFLSMSLEQEDELFAEGLSEEMLISLSGIKDLKVAARRSSFAYKGNTTNIKDIGKDLNVSYVLEGSIRRSGERMRITAQLVSVETGFHLWSNSYDRELDDIFVVQDDIARQVARALDAQLTGPDVLFDAGTNNAAAFADYLEARQYLNRRGPGLALAIAGFEMAIEADPDYGRAYAGLATAHVVSHIYLNVPKDIAHKRAETFAHKALEIDPNASEPYAVLGVIQADQNNWEAAISYYKQGEALNPEDVTILQWYAEALTYLGYLKEAEVKILKATEIDPDSAVLALVAGIVYQNIDDIDRTELFYRRSETLGLSDGVNGNAFVEIHRGNVETAAHMMAVASFHDQYISEAEVSSLEAFFLKIMGKEQSVDEAIRPFPVLAADDDFMTPAYMIAGESEKALKLIETDPDGDHDSFYLLWTSLDPAMRQHPYFQKFIRNTGLYDFWLKEGWPDKCEPVKQAEPVHLHCT